MKMWVVREHRGDSYRLFFQEEPPTKGEDHYWHHDWSLRGIEIPRLLFPQEAFPDVPYDKPIEVEFKLKRL